MQEIFLEYADYLTSDEDDLLKELRRETYLKTLFPRMLSGHLQGKILEFISILKKPSSILELGTFTGYSTICLAKGLKSDGKITTIEINDELQDIIFKYFKKAGIIDKVNVIFDDALNVIPNLNDKFDLVFIDADKKHYPEYYKLVFDKVNPEGLIIIDNIFWNGKIFEQPTPKDTYTQGVLKLNNLIKNDTRVEKLTLPVRDGLMILRKVKG